MKTTTPIFSNLSIEIADEQAHILKAISDPSRLRILAVLRRHGDMMCVKELVKCFDLEQPAISHHLRILYDAKIISRYKHGVYTYYRCNAEGLARAAEIVQGLLCVTRKRDQLQAGPFLYCHPPC